MKISKGYLLIVALMTIFIGCSSRTHQSEYTKLVSPSNVYYNIAVGYEEFQISSNKYSVTYSGYVSNNKNDVMKFAHKRAKEICNNLNLSEYDTSNSSINEEKIPLIGSEVKRYIYSIEITCK